jgi:hypothetical protein
LPGSANSDWQLAKPKINTLPRINADERGSAKDRRNCQNLVTAKIQKKPAFQIIPFTKLPNYQVFADPRSSASISGKVLLLFFPAARSQQLEATC